MKNNVIFFVLILYTIYIIYNQIISDQPKYVTQLYSKLYNTFEIEKH